MVFFLLWGLWFQNVLNSEIVFPPRQHPQYCFLWNTMLVPLWELLCILLPRSVRLQNDDFIVVFDGHLHVWFCLPLLCMSVVDENFFYTFKNRLFCSFLIPLVSISKLPLVKDVYAFFVDEEVVSRKANSCVPLNLSLCQGALLFCFEENDDPKK